MTQIDRQISENVAVLMLRRKWEKKDLGERLGLSGQSVGQRINGRVGWKPSELAVLAEVFDVTTDELMGSIPPYKEWDQRRQHPRQALRSVAGDVRWLVAPEVQFDALPQPLSAWGPTSDIMSVQACTALADSPSLPLAALSRDVLARDGSAEPIDQDTPVRSGLQACGVRRRRRLTAHTEHRTDLAPRCALASSSRHQRGPRTRQVLLRHGDR